MAKNKNIAMIWAFGLSGAQLESLRRLMGKKYQLSGWPVGIVPSLMDYESALPCLALFSIAALKAARKLPELSIRHLELLPKLMVLDEGYSQQDLEFAVDSGMSEIIRPPYAEAQVKARLRRALEIEAVQYDVLRMSKEIIVEREILERKNDILNFLVDFLTSTSMTMNMEEIIEMTAEKLQTLFPVRSMQAAIWNCKDNAGDTEVYISAQAKRKSFDGWMNTVRGAVESARPGLALNLKAKPITLRGQEEKWQAAGPADGHIITLPICMDDRQFGLLLVLTDTMRGLSRDQALALNSALRHLALTIKNAQSYLLMKKLAEFDGLTGVHNRRNFDLRIKAEVERALRYDYPLSIIFADLDHFKKVNDTYGHCAGDAVLREMAKILQETLRDSDYVARYGGEEFAIILPHTGIKQAFALSERIRRQVAARKFETGSGKIRITVSQGVAELAALGSKTPEELMSEADKALYRAKSAGRNRTVSASAPPAQVAV